MTTMLRVSTDVRDRAAALATGEGVSIGELVARSLDAYERERFWEQTQRALLTGEPFEDPDEGWDVTVGDGLEDA